MSTRTKGGTPLLGVAAGPMAAVARELSQARAAGALAIANYIAALGQMPRRHMMAEAESVGGRMLQRL
ncbi:MAG: hypothetical protein JO213_00390 [Alphaproteobacteria bacterium]|nr:hypothetical protein [Alphaproteobacteria bacterium]